MAEIEQFLLHQLDAAIKKTESSTNTLSNLFKLHNDCRDLKGFIEKKEPKTGASSDKVRREKLYYLNNIMAQWQMLLTQHHRSTPEIVGLVMNLRRSLKQIRKDLQGGVSEEDENIKGGQETSSKKDLETYRWSSPSVDPTKIHGIEDKVKIMERVLVSQEKKEFRAIGIVGMAGVGKTALCKVAFNDKEVKKCFLPRIWVCLSKQPEDADHKKEVEVVKRILICLGLEDKIIDKLNQEGGLRKLLLALRQQLKGKRYLILLDDVWNLEKGVQKFCSLSSQDKNIDPEQLTYGLPKGHGGTVVVTSRSRDIAEDMVGKTNLHTLLPLANRESCWKTFMDAVMKDGIGLPEDMDMLKEGNLKKDIDMLKEKNLKKDMDTFKERILKNCAELPLIAKMMGQIVHEKLQEQRENAQNQTQKETQQLEA